MVWWDGDVVAGGLRNYYYTLRSIFYIMYLQYLGTCCNVVNVHSLPVTSYNNISLIVDHRTFCSPIRDGIFFSSTVRFNHVSPHFMLYVRFARTWTLQLHGAAGRRLKTRAPVSYNYFVRKIGFESFTCWQPVAIHQLICCWSANIIYSLVLGPPVCTRVIEVGYMYTYAILKARLPLDVIIFASLRLHNYNMVLLYIVYLHRMGVWRFSRCTCSNARILYCCTTFAYACTSNRTWVKPRVMCNTRMLTVNSERTHCT